MCPTSASANISYFYETSHIVLRKKNLIMSSGLAEFSVWLLMIIIYWALETIIHCYYCKSFRSVEKQSHSQPLSQELSEDYYLQH